MNIKNENSAFQAYENLRDECEGVIDVTSKEFQDIKV